MTLHAQNQSVFRVFCQSNTHLLISKVTRSWVGMIHLSLEQMRWNKAKVENIIKGSLDLIPSPSPSVNFPANNLNFHWRWWDWIQHFFLNLFYFTDICEMVPGHLKIHEWFYLKIILKNLEEEQRIHVLIKSPMTRQNCEQFIKLDYSFSIHTRRYQTM